MATAPLSLQKDYWNTFEVSDEDLEFLYNYLLEVEQPQTSEDLIRPLVEERIRKEKSALEARQLARGIIYLPQNHYEVGQTIQLPALDWKTGKVTAVRPGSNPDLPPFEVIEVQFNGSEKRLFAAGLEDHALNHPNAASADPMLDPDQVIATYGTDLTASLTDTLESSPDLTRIGFKWFPRALLVDINIGHLNLAEAVLDMVGGGPLPTRDLMEQVDLPDDVDANLNEFSLNYALQEDKRFDEVGPAGEVLWFLHRLEPEPVRETPLHLRYARPAADEDDLSEDIIEAFKDFGPQVIDELQPELNPPAGSAPESVTFCLLYPHLRSGTLPLAGALGQLFPTAYESPRIQFTFVDGNTGDGFSGWVVRPNHYVYGLQEWYSSQGLIAGSLIHVQQGKAPGEVLIRAEKKRGVRDWVRTAVIGSDGGVVYSMLKHNLTATFDERMAIVVSDMEALDKVWENNAKKRVSLAQTIRTVMGEMAKLSPQSHVHAQELYAGINILRRCPPGPILNLLFESPWAKHLGNLYFRLEDASGGDTA